LHFSLLSNLMNDCFKIYKNCTWIARKPTIICYRQDYLPTAALIDALALGMYRQSSCENLNRGFIPIVVGFDFKPARSTHLNEDAQSSHDDEQDQQEG
jgi:hypothetical protein